MSEQQDEPTPLDVLNAAVTTFVNSNADRPTLVDVALVIWEEVSCDDNGQAQRSIDYAVPTDNFSLSGGLGLIEAAGEYVRRGILGERGDD